MRSITHETGRAKPGPDGEPLAFAWDTELVDLVKTKQQAMARILAERTKCVVQSGPFQGLQYIDEVSWGDLGSKLLGLYEQELHTTIDRLANRGHDVVVNVGCSEGYYAAGLGLRLPETRIVACDTDPVAREVCASVLAQNGLAERSTVLGEITPESLSALLAPLERPLLVVDCEGYESTLLDPERVPELARCDILVECHDFLDRAITPTLLDRFEKTHDIERVDEQSRNPWQSPWLASLGAFEAMLLVCEFRPEPMHWLVIQARAEADG